MRTRRRLTRFADYRSALSARGEVEIGVAARRRRRRNLIIATMGIAFMGGAGWLYWSLLPDAESVAGERFRVKVHCINESCGFTGVVEVTAGRKFPLICPRCKQRSAQQLWQCRDCGYEFLPKQVGTTVRCPRCGSVAVGTAVVDEP